MCVCVCECVCSRSVVSIYSEAIVKKIYENLSIIYALALTGYKATIQPLNWCPRNSILVVFC